MNEMSEPILKEYDIESDVLGNTRKIWIQAPAQARRTPGLAVFLDGNYIIWMARVPGATMSLLKGCGGA
jgi:hypothetical protein